MEEKIIEIIADKLDMEPSEISLSTSFEDLKVDSLDMVQIVMDIEEEYDIQIDEAEGLKTVQDVVDYIDSKK